MALVEATLEEFTPPEHPDPTAPSEEEVARQLARAAGIAKLMALGLTEEEAEALAGNG